MKRALQNHSLDLLTEQVNKMVSKGVFEELSDNEILSLGERPHNFCMFNHVFNDKLKLTKMQKKVRCLLFVNHCKIND